MTTKFMKLHGDNLRKPKPKPKKRRKAPKPVTFSGKIPLLEQATVLRVAIGYEDTAQYRMLAMSMLLEMREAGYRIAKLNLTSEAAAALKAKKAKP